VVNDYTLASELDRQFGDLPVGLRKILLSMIHGLACTPTVSFTLTTCSSMLARDRPVGPILTLEPYEPGAQHRFSHLGWMIARASMCTL
jgi:hypothetical protein